MKSKLIIFTRYPRAGHTKTRMIEALGPAGAADLQRQLTEQAVQTAENLAGRCSLNLEIRYWGGSLGQMQKWLGPNRLFCEQGPGDLGEKMARAFTEAFEDDYHQVMLIGADCPHLSPAILATGFSRLADHDLILGPASDGGYYLIGLTRPCPDLFRHRSWGSNLLLAETVAAAKRSALNLYLLEELPDVDRPEDLIHFGNYSHPQ